MKRSKGIGPNNLGASKSAVKNQNKGYGSVATKIGMGAESSIAQFNDTLETKAEKGELNPGFTKAIMDNKKKEEGSMAPQTRAEIKANKLALKAEKAVKDDNMKKNEKLVGRHNDFVKRKGLDKKPIAYG